MKAIRAATTGGPEVLRYEDAAVPTPGPGQVRVRLAATGLNYIETYQRTGLYPVAFPWTPGGEGAGEIVGVGPGVASLRVGDRVASHAFGGSYAEEALLAEDRAVRVPSGMDLKLAAAALLQGMTAHYLVFTTFPLKPGAACVVHAAAGGVGLLLVQLAKRCGARVFATVSTEEKARLATAAGADRVVRYTSEDFEAVVKGETGGRGVDVVYDSVGKDTFEKSLNCLRPLGMMVSYGQSSGPIAPFAPGILGAKGSLFLTRPSLFHYVADRASLERRAGDVLGWVSDGSLKLRIGATFPLAQAADAHRALEGRATTGKVLLIP